MATEHYCDKKKGENKWAEGPVKTCPLHGFNGKKQLGYREGRKDRAKRDQEAGVLGTERVPYDAEPGRASGYISG